MKAIRKKDGKVIEVDSTPYFNMKTDEEYRRCLSDGKHYKLSDLDFNVKEAEQCISVAKLREVLMDMAMPTNEFRPEPTIARTVDEIINQVKKSI